MSLLGGTQVSRWNRITRPVPSAICSITGSEQAEPAKRDIVGYTKPLPLGSPVASATTMYKHIYDNNDNSGAGQAPEGEQMMGWTDQWAVVHAFFFFSFLAFLKQWGNGDQWHKQGAYTFASPAIWDVFVAVPIEALLAIVTVTPCRVVFTAKTYPSASEPGQLV